MSTIWTLLITDDCAEDREIYREYLLNDPHQSYQILEAASAEVGLELFQKRHCDAILLDFCLPDMNGLEFLDALRQQGVDSPFPVIMLTGQGNEQVAVQALKRGAQDYLVKQQLVASELQMAVRNVIQQSHLQQPLDSTSGQQHGLIADIALRMRRSLNLEQVLQTAVTEIRQLLECDRIVIYQGMPSTQPSVAATEFSLTPLYEAGSMAMADPIQQLATFAADYAQQVLTDRVGDEGLPPGKVSALVSRSRKKTPDAYLLAPILIERQRQRSGTQQPTQPGVDGDADLPTAFHLWGLLVACKNAPHQQWRSDQVDLLNQLVGHLAIAIQQAEQLNQALMALDNERQLNTFKSHFVATVSRSYRSPLATVLAAVNTLKRHRDQLQEAKQQHFLQLIEDKARQMAQIVDDLLVLETFDAGKTSFTPLPFEVLQFFSDIIVEQQEAVGDRYELSFKITGNTRGFWGDQKLLRQILTHLLANAMQASPDGSEVEVLLKGDRSHIHFSVRDRGMGIPPADRDKLFQFFNRGTSVDSFPGIGLGLLIVKTCVELHRGEIQVESQPDEGTMVTVHLQKQPL